MSCDAYGWENSRARRDIDCHVGPPSASTRTSSTMSSTCRAAHDQHGKATLVEAVASTQRLLLAWRWRAETHVDGKAEELHAVARHASPYRYFPRHLRRRHHQVGLAERPPAMEVHQVGDD